MHEIKSRKNFHNIKFFLVFYNYFILDTSQILSNAKEALRIEIQELKKLEERLSEEFCRAVEHIFSMKGKLIVVGIGKSAHVGNKIVATLNSTGTPAQFLHAAEAIHGDLGVLQNNDIVLCISNSGNSPEIVALAPFLKKYSHALIAMTGNLESKLATEADIVLDTRVDMEACPNNLAPTSSTTAQMALGDALAVALMKQRKFESSDFAKFHPGGSLGKNLTAIVKQFMSENKPQVHPNSDLKEVIVSISASKHGVTAVVEHGKICGVITDGDLRRMLMNDTDLKQTLAKDIMSKSPKTISPNDLAKTALDKMKIHNIGQLIVEEDEKYIGIIDLHRLLDEGII